MSPTCPACGGTDCPVSTTRPAPAPVRRCAACAARWHDPADSPATEQARAASAARVDAMMDSLRDAIASLPDAAQVREQLRRLLINYTFAALARPHETTSTLRDLNEAEEMVADAIEAVQELHRKAVAS